MQDAENRQEQQGVQLQGTVERVVFRNEDNGWTVMEVESAGEYHKVVGVLPPVNPGEQVTLTGKWVEHPSFGPQFRAEHCQQQLPTGSDAILRYLSSGAIKGIGPSTAARILKKFGDEALQILEREPRRLAEIPGISLKKALKMGEEFAGQFGLREVMLTFSQYGLTPSEALRCWKKWGTATVGMIRENPYVLCSSGLYIGFERADRICMGMDRSSDEPRRVEAGLLYVLRHNLGNGHTCLPADKLVPAAADMLGIDTALADEVLEQMLTGAASPLKEAQWNGRRFVYLERLYRAEQFIAARLRLMTGFPPLPERRLEEQIDAVERSGGLHYEARQRQAIREAIEKGVLILTGGPGTGKTTTLRAIIRLLEGMGETVAIAAPTGRAAKRIAELTGCEAKTLHRLLEVQWDDDDTPVYDRNERNPLDADAVVVDELSMVDTLLFESLLRALKSGCRLIMVGDSDQLPSVGPGSVLHDLMDSGVLPKVELTEVFRQAQESHIILNAHRIVEGTMPEIGYKDGDFFFMAKGTEEEVAQTVQELCDRRLPARYGYTVFDGIQVLCPGRKGFLGTGDFNRRLQACLNPAQEGKREITVEGILFRVGDKVMHVRNNYDIVWTRDDGETGSGVFNGDIGILEEIDPREGTLSVRFEDRTALYTKQEAQDLELAYAATVHKSQGSEFDAVILPLYRTQRQLCYRNLLYTAVTRAKSLLIIVGSRQTLADMVDNNRKTLRYTGLCHMMRETVAVDL